MGGLACKQVIDDRNADGMGEELIGAVRQLQSVLKGVNEIIPELSEYLTEKEKKETLDFAYDICKFGDEVMQPFSVKIRTFSKKVADYYINLAKIHQDYEHSYVSGQIQEKK